MGCNSSSGDSVDTNPRNQYSKRSHDSNELLARLAFQNILHDSTDVSLENCSLNSQGLQCIANGSTKRLHNVFRLNISNNDFSTLIVTTKNLECAYPMLRSLDISHNHDLQDYSQLSSLSGSLTSLNCSSNALMRFPPEIYDLALLTSLDLSWNSIWKIPRKLLLSCKWLRTLRMEHCELKSLPEEMGDSELSVLSLKHNSFEEFPLPLAQNARPTCANNNANNASNTEFPIPTKFTFDNASTYLSVARPSTKICGSLMDLDLSHNRIRSVPHTIGYLTRLISLNLSRNRLTSLPTELRQLASLKYLNLSNNKLQAFIPEICELTGLIKLDLDFNCISFVSPDINQLRSLRSLSLRHNQLVVLPINICRCTNLRVLSLSHNKLLDLPDDMTNLTNLVSLDLSANRLAFFDINILYWPKLEYIRLGDNPDLKLPQHLLKSPQKLMIYLQGKYLSDVPGSTNIDRFHSMPDGNWHDPSFVLLNQSSVRPFSRDQPASTVSSVHSTRAILSDSLSLRDECGKYPRKTLLRESSFDSSQNRSVPRMLQRSSSVRSDGTSTPKWRRATTPKSSRTITPRSVSRVSPEML